MTIKSHYLQLGLALFLAVCFFVFGGKDAQASKNIFFTAEQNGIEFCDTVNTGGPCSTTVRNNTLVGGQYLQSWNISGGNPAWLNAVATVVVPCAPQTASCGSINYDVTNTNYPAGTVLNTTITVTSDNGSDIVNIRLTITAGGTGVGSACSVGITPDATIAQGQSATITWSSSNCDSVSVSGGSGATSLSSTSANGNQPITFNSLGTSVYTITGVKAGQPNTTDTATINVVAAGGCIVDVDVSPNNISYGGSIDVSWSSNNCTSTSVSGPGLSSTTPSGNNSFTNVTASRTYTITGQPGNVTDSDTVNVNAALCSVDINSPASIPAPAFVTVTWTSDCDVVNVSVVGGASLYSNSPTGNASVHVSSNATFNIAGASAGMGAWVTDSSTTNVGSPPAGCSVTVVANPPSVLLNSTTQLSYYYSAGCVGPTFFSVTRPDSTFTNNAPPASSICAAGTYNGGPSPITCNSVPLNQFGDYYFGFNNQDSSGTGAYDSERVSTTVPYACTINIRSTFNGVDQEPPYGFDYRLTGPEIINGNFVPRTYNRVAANENWIASTTNIGQSSDPGDPTINLINITPSNSGSCVAGQNTVITFTYNFTDGYVAPIVPPNTPTVENTALNASVACGQIRVSWNAVANATSYRIYRNTTTNPPVAPLTSVGTTSFTDNSVSLSTTYYYWVEAVGAVGQTSGLSPRSAAISPSPCQADFTNRYKRVNNNNISGLKTGDIVTLTIQVPNNGAINATSVQVTDDLANTNLEFDDSFNPTITVNGSPAGSFSRSGTLLTFNMGPIAASQSGTITFRARITAPAGSTQPQLRLRNRAEITFSTALPPSNNGCAGTGTNAANPCVADTGYIIFSNGATAPSQREINPYQ
jgi:hypothetical protein